MDDLDSIFDHLAAFIYHTDDICLECTCITLSLFSYYGVRACQKILDKINIEKFLSLLRHPSEKILWPVLIVCANILSGNVCQSQLLLDFNLIASLLSLLETAKNDNIRYCIFLVATRICLGSDNQRQVRINVKLITNLFLIKNNIKYLYELKRLIDAGMFALARDDFETAHVQIKVQIALLFISALTCCTNNCPMIRQQSDQIFTLHLFDTFCEMLKLCDVALFQNNIRRTDKFLTALVCIIRKAEAEQFQENPPKEVPLSLHGYICKERNNLIPFISLMRMKTPFQIDSVPESQTIQNIVDFLYTTEETTKNSGSVSSTTTKKEERYIRRVTQP